MPLFMAVHKWKPDEQTRIMGETIALFTALREGKAPEGVDLYAVYTTESPGAFCL